MNLCSTSFLQNAIAGVTVERIHPKAPVIFMFIAIFTCLPTCINLSTIAGIFIPPVGQWGTGRDLF